MSSSTFYPSGLNKWEAGDKPQRMDFVKDNEIIDSRLTPTGTIHLYGGATAPSGWLICNGQAVSRTTYNKLFAVCGITYGSGNGSSTFNVPDMRNRFPIGAGTLGGKAGEVNITLNSQQIPAHAHYVLTDLDPGGPLTGLAYAVQGKAFNNTAPIKGWASSTCLNLIGGDGGAHSNMPPYVSLHFIIKT